MVAQKQIAPPGSSFGWADLLVLGLLIAMVYAVIAVAREWTGPLQTHLEIQTHAKYLPLYALFSLTRGLCAYGISFLFTLVYGYTMARARGAERVMLPVLDILQSIPVLGFLPGFVLGLVHLFPHRNFGLELASVLMIFTGQAWNMTFSFYSSLKAIPPDLVAVSRLTKMSWWERFLRLELPFSATGLVWNSMMSMAGGWFFLMVSEAFVLGEHDFRLPGLGSYMSVAIERGDVPAQIMGVLAMLALIAFFDQLVWRPVVAWSQKFTDEENTINPSSWVWERIQRSKVWSSISSPVGFLWRRSRPVLETTMNSSKFPKGVSSRMLWTLRWILGTGILLGITLGLLRYAQLLTTLTRSDWLHLLASMLATFLRVGTSVLLATLWTVPVGVLIGSNPRWTRVCQPLIQMAASFPAPMIFPLIVATMMRFGVGLGFSSVVLLLLGTQWYVLFNVIAGASLIPKEFWEVSHLARFTVFHRWQKLILPALFPSLLTGWITAMGGGWNASIVAEYMKFRGETLTTTGLGSTISQATEQGDFHILAAAIGVMALAVVGLNRLVWHPLSHRAQTRYSISS